MCGRQRAAARTHPLDSVAIDSGGVGRRAQRRAPILWRGEFQRNATLLFRHGIERHAIRQQRIICGNRSKAERGKGAVILHRHIFILACITFARNGNFYCAIKARVGG